MIDWRNPNDHRVEQRGTSILESSSRPHGPERQLSGHTFPPRRVFRRPSVCGCIPTGPMAAAEVEATEVKIVLLGDSGVGKSSVAAQFVRGTYDNMQQPTIG
jgi:hypothetical protein